MCMTRVHPEPEPTTVPNRPVLRIQPPPARSHRSSLSVERRPSSRPHAHAPSSASRSHPDHHQQAVVISQVSPRSSRTSVQIRPLRHAAYLYGNGQISAGAGNEALLGVQDAGLELAQRRRSSSMTYAKSPRQSGASLRTTRERIVVEEGGRRREYYRRDDSGAGKHTHG